MEAGQKIREMRLAQGMTQKQLAAKSGLSVSVIQKYESGDRKPKFETLIKIAMALSVFVNDLMDDGNHFDVGQRIKALRENIPYTQEELAYSVGIPVEALAHIENGAFVNTDTLSRIARVLGVPSSALIDSDLVHENSREIGLLAFNDILEDIFDLVKEEKKDGEIYYVCISEGKEYRIPYERFGEIYDLSKALIKTLITSSNQ